MHSRYLQLFCVVLDGVDRCGGRVGVCAGVLMAKHCGLSSMLLVLLISIFMPQQLAGQQPNEWCNSFSSLLTSFSSATFSYIIT
jgi:hypothetical protein